VLPSWRNDGFGTVVVVVLVLVLVEVSAVGVAEVVVDADVTRDVGGAVDPPAAGLVLLLVDRVDASPPDRMLQPDRIAASTATPASATGATAVRRGRALSDFTGARLCPLGRSATSPLCLGRPAGDPQPPPVPCPKLKKPPPAHLG
jgi:hypothetical protein